MGKNFLIDTNVIIDFQTNSLSAGGRDYVSKLLDDNFIISFVSYIEVLGYKYVTVDMEGFIALADVIELSPTIINQTIQLRRNYKIKFPDALIAATALVHNLKLLTHNSKDFAGIKGLSIVDPHKEP